MATPIHLGPMKTIATYELVADQIQRAVHLGLLVPGDRLPGERTLAQQLGVPRMTVRSALRLLAHDGRITMQRGVGGGIWIQGEEFTRRQLLQFAQGSDKSIGDVYEFRAQVEGIAARLAAERAKQKEWKSYAASARGWRKFSRRI